MKLDDLNTSMLDDVRFVLSFSYVIKTDKDGKREYIIEPKLSWHDNSIVIEDKFGFTHKYESSNINISTNSIFIYSFDRVVQDLYVGYNTLTTRERNNYDKFLGMREFQSFARTPIDLSLLQKSIQVIIGNVIAQLQSFDYLDRDYVLAVNDDFYDLRVDIDNLTYSLFDEDDTLVIKAYSFEYLIFDIIKMLSKKHKFKINPGLKKSLVGETALAKIYDFNQMKSFDIG